MTGRERRRILGWKVGGTVVAGILGWLIVTTLRRPRTRLEAYQREQARKAAR